ncbi:glycosyltransferase family 2 protein [Egbenema bharatensis]|uniref:glycosyltransferase family 2 protein n=1 Tax=Egbenema bharatensis TaxID=3463334 RepID=UPI003A8BCB29
MKLSVILPCFNGAKTIDVQLNALASQQWSGEWEVIVVNNGSTDHSMEIVERYRDRLPNLQIVDAYEPGKPRLGVAHSDNVGVKAATGDAFCFCESDDEVCPDWLEKMADALSCYEFVAGPLEYTRLNEPWLVAAINNGRWKQSERLMDDFTGTPPYLPFAFGCNLGMRRSVYEKVGEFDTSLYAAWDTDYCWKVQLAGIQLHFIPGLVVHYRLRHELKAIYRQARSWGKDWAPWQLVTEVNRLGSIICFRKFGPLFSVWLLWGPGYI